jgi:hypothetical protein
MYFIERGVVSLLPCVSVYFFVGSIGLACFLQRFGGDGFSETSFFCVDYASNEGGL